jgi:hypothetical protein
MQRFIVGTGRCGSTLLSTLMAHHPDALVLSEFFGGLDLVNAFTPDLVDGDRLAEILLRDHEVSKMNRARNMIVSETTLDIERYRTRRIPAIMSVCLPSLTDDPEALLRKIVEWARARAPAPVSSHYPALFDWLTALFGKRFWIERSGGSSEFFPGLRRTFPEARYFHIHRDGAEAAMSMSHHAHFKTHVSFYFDPPSDADIVGAIRSKGMAEDDLIIRRRDNPPSPKQYGQFWTTSVCLLLSEVGQLDRDQYKEARFEDLRADPQGFLKGVCEYFQIEAGGGWIDEAVAAIRPESHARASTLTEAERAELKEAIFPGQVLLKRAGRTRPNLETYARIRRNWDEEEPGSAFFL